MSIPFCKGMGFFILMVKLLSMSPWSVILPVGLGTGLSLMGDASLYAVLPTHAEAAGVSLASVGILLSANRFIRLILNGPAGLAYDQWPRRPLFIGALFVGAGSTAIYALTQGFWPLLGGRLLWGLAWSGIWVGGNTIILDISDAHSRGRWVGIYQISFFLGASTGAISGGFLTDRLGYHPAMAVGAGVTLLGAVIALLFLPETRPLSQCRTEPAERSSFELVETSARQHRAEFVSVLALLGVNRLVVAGVFMSTFGLLLLEKFGDAVQVGSLMIGIATLTGLSLGANSLMAMVAAPLLGGLSDRLGSRWRVAAGGLGSGTAGLSLLAAGLPWSIMLGLPLTAVAGGGNQGLSTALVGDLSGNRRQGRQLGILFTTGDLASAVGPLLAYSLLVQLGLAGLYLASSGLFALMFLIAWYWATSLKSEHNVTIN